MHDGFWYKNSHTAYGRNDTIGNIVKALKCLYKITQQTNDNLNTEIAARKEADAQLLSHIHNDFDNYVKYDAPNTNIIFKREDF